MPEFEIAGNGTLKKRIFSLKEKSSQLKIRNKLESGRDIFVSREGGGGDFQSRIITLIYHCRECQYSGNNVLNADWYIHTHNK